MLLAGFLLCACGGGIRNEQTQSGSLELQILWPSSRLIPNATESLKVSVRIPDSSQSLETKIVARPLNQQQSSNIVFDSLPGGDLVVEVEALDQNGVVIAIGSAELRILVGDQNRAEVTVASTIQSLKILPNDLILSVGETRALSVEARNASNQIALVSTSDLAWSQDSGTSNIGTISSIGELTGISEGLFTIEVSLNGTNVKANKLVLIRQGLGVVFSDNFSGSLDSKWTGSAGITTSPNGQKFLGQHGNQTVNLTLSDLIQANRAVVSFDLYILQTWDGSTNNGPDSFGLKVNGTTVRQWTFSNTDGSPQSYPLANSLRGTGSSGTNTLGYTPVYGPSWASTKYSITLNIDNPGQQLQVGFFGNGLEPIFNESWGIDNVVVTLE